MTSRKKKKHVLPKSLELRSIERQDLSLLRAWKNDPEARRWVGGGTRTFSVEEMERWFDRAESMDNERRWIVEEASHPVGFVGLYGIDSVCRHAELGVLLGPSARGRGIGKAATKLLLDEAFWVLNLHRVYVHILADHPPALTMCSDNGFVEEGRLRQHNFKAGRYADVIVMGILASEHGAAAQGRGPKARNR
jgi:RimJ/RimL family protein N-acetyltransferase